jgi:hypothetical protein
MKKLALTLLAIIFSSMLLAQDYQYQELTEPDAKYVPFSDYIPRIRLHYRTVPHYVEDFYLLYGMKEYYDENSLRKNIERMQKALFSKFRHPSEALVKTESEQEYRKYRKLMFMHINLLIMRDHLKIAARYDKQKINFYNLPFAKEIRESLDTADRYYKEAVPFWKQARKYAKEASLIKVTTDLSSMESERYSIIHEEVDYDRIIGDHIRRLDSKKRRLDSHLASNPR